MKSNRVAIIDYGVGNLLSVNRAFEYCGARVEVTSDPKLILDASHVVLPGVGSFSEGMKELRYHKLESIIHEVVANNTPLLGICLGMQMLLDVSEEYGITAGLGLITGRVIPIPICDIDGRLLKIPHIGWNSLLMPKRENTWVCTPLQEIKSNETFYFVHSYMAIPVDQSNLLAYCEYGGHHIPAVIKKGNITGCQFHPEKSGKAGLKVISQFLK